MKKITKLKLSEISKANMDEKELQNIHGGSYCAWGQTNRASNNDEGKCSCLCSGDYYSGLHSNGDFMNASDW